MLFLFLSGHSYGAECRESKLSFIPYSSSINGAGSSNLTEAIPYKQSQYLKKSLDQQIIRYDEVLDIDPKVSLNSFNQNVVKRYDKLRSSVLGKTKPILKDLRAEVLDVDAPEWAGLCNQFSAASVNPKISSYLNSINGVICPSDILFSKEELSELFTAFYKYDKSEYFFGTRNYLPTSLLQKDLIKEFGIDELDPSSIVNFLHINLSANQGVIFDNDLSEEVWNNPIFNIKTCTTDEDHSSLDIDILKYLPLKYLKTNDIVLRKLIDILKSTQLKFENLVRSVPQNTPKENVLDKAKNIVFGHLSEKRRAFATRQNAFFDTALQDIEKKAFSKIMLALKSSKLLRSKIPEINRLIEEKSNSPIYFKKQVEQFRFFALREYVLTVILKQAIEDGVVSIKENITIVKHASKVTFKKYNGFVSPTYDRLESLYGDFDINYLTIKDNNKNQVVWISDTSLMPDFLWLPPKKQQYDFFEEDRIEELWDVLSQCRSF